MGRCPIGRQCWPYGDRIIGSWGVNRNIRVLRGIQVFLIQAKLAFPFRLSIAEAAFPVVHDGKRYSIRCISGNAKRTFEYGLLTPPGQSGNWEWLSACFNKDGKSIPNREICFTGDIDHFLAKHNDHVGYAFLDVLFEVQPPNPRGDDARLSAIMEEAVQVAQHFVDVYREVTQEPDVFHPKIEDSPGIELFVSSEYLWDREGAEGSFNRISRRIRWESEQASGLVKEPLSEATIQALGKKLLSGYTPPLHIELLLDGKEYSVVNKNHRLAIVVIQTAFETFVQARLLQECKNRRLLSLPVGRNQPAERAPEEAIQAGGLKEDLLGTYFRTLTGANVRETPEYHSWHRATYDPRNQIVHGGRRDATEAEAREAFESTVALMNLINGLLGGESLDP